jgi:hypothetical protein
MQDARVSVGPLDFDALGEIHRIFEEDGLVVETEWDDPLNPRKLQIHFVDGFDEQTSGRIDAKWTTNGYYSFHYSQSELDFRFDCHPKPGVPDAHFHPPPDARTAVASCIDVDSASLVARAVHKCWREAYEADYPAEANTLSDPP